VVEGGEQLRNGIRRVLNGAGFEVVGAQEGHAGLTFYRETPPDAVVVNMTLPDMDGVEFVRKLKDGFPRARIIAIAPRKTHGAVDALALAGGMGEIHQLRWPFEPAALLELVRQVVPKS
jgi:DNA-binding response OmpR family regulator